MNQEPIFLIDWLTFSISSESNFDIEHVIEFLGLDSIDSSRWQVRKGNRFYRESISFENIIIYYNGINDKNYILVEMSGQGCRTFETFSTVDFYFLFERIINDNYFNITHIDIAADFKYDIIPLKQVARQVDEGEYVTPSRSYSVISSSKGITVYIGDNESDRMLRIYDKKSERFHKKVIVDCDVWIRFELVLRRDFANLFISDLLYTVQDIGQCYKNHLYNFVRFIKMDATRKERCSDSDWYSDFIGEIEPVKKITRCDQEYAFEKLDYWVTDNMNSAIRTYVDIFGWDSLKESIERKKKPLSAKYYKLQQQSRGLTELQKEKIKLFGREDKEL